MGYIAPDCFSLWFTESIGSMVGVEAGEGGGRSWVKDVDTLGPFETKVPIQVHSPGYNILMMIITMTTI